tara:strand:+ start:689 stop:880 length:192 start_codon:yes stop_codon:yes gene_type:complete
MSDWKAPTDNPRYSSDLSDLISNLKQATEMLEDQIRKDEASIKRLELEMKKLKAQRKNGVRHG